MDVHKENYTLCCYSFDRDKVEYRQTVPSDYRLILKYLEQVRRKYPEEVEFICGYEAGCLGYSLYHQLTDHGVKCIILAPTTMGITNTNRVKTDRKDAANIARGWLSTPTARSMCRTAKTMRSRNICGCGTIRNSR